MEVGVPWLRPLVSPAGLSIEWLTVGLGTCFPPSWVPLKWKVGLLSHPTSWLLSFFGSFHFPAWGSALAPSSLWHNDHTLSFHTYLTRRTKIPEKVGRSFSCTGTQFPMVESLNVGCFDLKLQVTMKSWGLPTLWKGVGLHFKMSSMNYERKGTSSRS